ncbi:hypothetical protein T492DRAFT_1122425 [Pavlovales sp. CCMP2436]|nr:hypothetical protein T492DRAFT_1122425 [Pavlovales sp. CCMP2436]
MPTAREAIRGLAEAPSGEATWDLFENYTCLDSTPMGEIAPALIRPESGGRPYNSAKALAEWNAGRTLKLAQPRTDGNAPTTGDTDGQLGALRRAEEDILRTGGTNVRESLTQTRNALRANADDPAVVTAAQALFTDEYLKVFMKPTTFQRCNILRRAHVL